jgi:hypothetical protein
MGLGVAEEIGADGFDVVAIDATDRECLAGHDESAPLEKLLDEIRRAVQAGGVVEDISFL